MLKKWIVQSHSCQTEQKKQSTTESQIQSSYQQITPFTSQG